MRVIKWATAILLIMLPLYYLLVGRVVIIEKDYITFVNLAGLVLFTILPAWVVVRIFIWLFREADPAVLKDYTLVSSGSIGTITPNYHRPKSQLYTVISWGCAHLAVGVLYSLLVYRTVPCANMLRFGWPAEISASQVGNERVGCDPSGVALENENKKLHR